MLSKGKYKMDEQQLDAVVKIIDHEWMVTFIPLSSLEICLPLSEADAWNYDVETGTVLVIHYRAETNTFSVLKRKKGNKKFVKIE
jgi:hypothetical protein